MNKLNIFIIAIITPLVVSMLVVNLFVSHLFLNIEYRMPWFPPDSYGFSFEERIKWGNATIDYLKYGDDFQDLNNLVLADGTQLYNEREISHLVDVKDVIDKLNLVFGLGLVILFLEIVYAFRKNDYFVFYKGIYFGSLFTLIGILSIGGFAAVSFWKFFAWFHSLFFQGDTWLFLTSDSLIRLFPIIFWQDAVLFILAIIIVVNLALFIIMKRKTA